MLREEEGFQFAFKRLLLFLQARKMSEEYIACRKLTGVFSNSLQKECQSCASILKQGSRQSGLEA